MSEHAKAKALKLQELLGTITALTVTMESPDPDDEKKFPGDTADNREKLEAQLTEAEKLRKSIEQDQKILGIKSFLEQPAGINPLGGDGAFSEAFGSMFGAGAKTLGEQFVEDELYKEIAKAGKVPSKTLNVGVDLKGFLDPRLGQKATFTTTSTGLDSSRNYIARPVELIQQQRLTIRDLLPVGETTQNTVYFIQETSFTNAADMTAEEGEKPEATLVLTNTNAPVKKIAVVLKVTEEMYADFPQLRDYINTRLRFMVAQKEESQLLNGDGTGNNITGILQTSGIQTQANAADNLVAIHKAKTKVMKPTTGGYNPTGLIINPTDWELLRLAKDLSGQYYGGGPFVGEYGVGQYVLYPPVWGLTPVVTTAITAGTALVGDFQNGAQIWQREGIRVESTNSNEDDFNFNRISIRVEERLALTVYAPGAFCKVTGLA